MENRGTNKARIAARSDDDMIESTRPHEWEFRDIIRESGTFYIFFPKPIKFGITGKGILREKQ